MLVQSSEVPDLQTLSVNADREIAAVGREGEREHSRGQQKKRFEGLCLIETGDAKVFGEPNGAAIRPKKHTNIGDAVEVGCNARPVPTCRAPEFHLPARSNGNF